jgi:hypothetical protein
MWRLLSCLLPQLLELFHSKSPHGLIQALYARLAEVWGLQTTVLAISKLLLCNKVTLLTKTSPFSFAS